MNFRPLIALLWIGALAASASQSPINVNSRYIVERVDISDGGKREISRTLREDAEKLVGRKLNPADLNKLARRIRKELNARRVTEKITRGTQSDHVIVLFEVSGKRPRSDFDVFLPKGLYHAKQGWSGALDSRVSIGASRFTLGLVSDGDDLLERYAGVRAGYEYTKVGTDRVHLGFQFASYHEKWNPGTGLALEATPEAPGVYRTRQDFAPSVTLLLAEPVSLTVGTSFQRFQTQFPAARTEAANAVTTTLRFARRLEDSHIDTHDLTAGYNLRAATNVLNTDFAYARHQVDVGYAFTRDHQTVAASFTAGRVSGNPPLFERFVLGNTSTLRGWHKFDLNPLGGTRVAHGSLEYRYHWFQIFYDAGALWNKGEDAEAKHSIGLGLRSKGGFFLALAFPIRSGRAEPIFMIGTVD